MLLSSSSFSLSLQPSHMQAHFTSIHALHTPSNMMTRSWGLTRHLTGPSRLRLTLTLSLLTIYSLINLLISHHSSCPLSLHFSHFLS